MSSLTERMNTLIAPISIWQQSVSPKTGWTQAKNEDGQTILWKNKYYWKCIESDHFGSQGGQKDTKGMILLGEYRALRSFVSHFRRVVCDYSIRDGGTLILNTQTGIYYTDNECAAFKEDTGGIQRGAYFGGEYEPYRCYWTHTNTRIESILQSDRKRVAKLEDVYVRAEKVEYCEAVVSAAPCAAPQEQAIKANLLDLRDDLRSFPRQRKTKYQEQANDKEFSTVALSSFEEEKKEQVRFRLDPEEIQDTEEDDVDTEMGYVSSKTDTGPLIEENVEENVALKEESVDLELPDLGESFALVSEEEDIHDLDRASFSEEENEEDLVLEEQSCNQVAVICEEEKDVQEEDLVLEEQNCNQVAVIFEEEKDVQEEENEEHNYNQSSLPKEDSICFDDLSLDGLSVADCDDFEEDTTIHLATLDPSVYTFCLIEEEDGGVNDNLKATLTEEKDPEPYLYRADVEENLDEQMDFVDFDEQTGFDEMLSNDEDSSDVEYCEANELSLSFESQEGVEDDIEELVFTGCTESSDDKSSDSLEETIQFKADDPQMDEQIRDLYFCEAPCASISPTNQDEEGIDEYLQLAENQSIFDESDEEEHLIPLTDQRAEIEETRENYQRFLDDTVDAQMARILQLHLLQSNGEEDYDIVYKRISDACFEEEQCVVEKKKEEQIVLEVFVRNKEDPEDDSDEYFAFV